MAIIGALFLVVGVFGGIGWLIFRMARHQPKKQPLILIAVGLVGFIGAASTSPSGNVYQQEGGVNAKQSVQVEAFVESEKDLRTNLMSKDDFSMSLYTQQVSKLSKQYKKITRESFLSGPEYYLSASASKAKKGQPALSGGLYVGAFKTLNQHIADKISKKSSKLVTLMHNSYLGK